MAKKNPAQNKESTPKPRGAVSWPVLFLVVTVVWISAYGAVKFLGPAALTLAAQPRQEPVETLDLGDKVVNLSNGGSSRYLRVRVVLEYPAQKRLSAEIKTKQPLITEKALTVFRGKSAEELLPTANQDKIKEEILKEINMYLQEGKVLQLYFTDFLVQ